MDILFDCGDVCMDIVTAVYTSGGTIDESMRNMFVLRSNVTKLRVIECDLMYIHFYVHSYIAKYSTACSVLCIVQDCMHATFPR